MKKNRDRSFRSKDEEQEDRKYADYKLAFGPLSDFLTDYDFSKGSQNLTQVEIARRMKTTQSAISRFEAMKNPPSYDFLQRISEVLGDELYLSPLGSMCLSVPYDLHDAVRLLSQAEGKSVKDYLQACLRDTIESRLPAGSAGVTEAAGPQDAPARCKKTSDWTRGRHKTGLPVSREPLSLKNYQGDLAA
jgi:transcriptional regulator with XRE-family HTH domain